jgi:purine-nucleoside phosphorylase
MLPDLSPALKLLGAEVSPRVAIVLGSGLGGLADSVSNSRRVPYEDIPGFPDTSVVGHHGELVVGELEGVPVILQNGRFHLYEGHDPSVVALPVRLFAKLGVEVLLLTNAAGGLNPQFRPPTLMLIADHVNLMWRNPLIGKRLSGEARWPDMLDVYDPELRSVARDVAAEAGIRLTEGVYSGVLGPSYETPAEIRMLRTLGCDAVGMSTVPEVIVARARGMRILGISSITNAGAGMSKAPLSHEEVLEASGRLAGNLERLVRGVVSRLGRTD